MTSNLHIKKKSVVLYKEQIQLREGWIDKESFYKKTLTSYIFYLFTGYFSIYNRNWNFLAFFLLKFEKNPDFLAFFY
jgi:hypothetical protein